MSNRNDTERSSEQFRKLFIGGLSFVTNEDALKSHFEQWGELVDVVVMRIGGKNGKSRGFGFVTYKDPDMVDAAQANRPHIIDNRTVETKRAMPRDEANSAESHMTVKKLFVGALKKEVVADDLRDYFVQFGNIIDCEIITWRETGESRGFGFVTFDDYDPVDKILLLKPHHIDRKRCEVKKALSKEEARSLKEKEESINSVGKSKFSQMSQSNGGMMGFMGGDMRQEFNNRYDNFGGSYQDYDDRFGRYPNQGYGGGPMRGNLNYRSQPYSGGGGGGGSRMRRDY